MSPSGAAAALDGVFAAYRSHLVRFAPIQSVLLGDAAALGRLDACFADGEAAWREESRALDELQRRLQRIATDSAELGLLRDVLATRLAERRLRPRLSFAHRRPDLVLDHLAEAVHQIVGWGGLTRARREGFLADLLGAVPAVLHAQAERLRGRPLPAELVELALGTVDDVQALLARDVAIPLARAARPSGAAPLRAALAAARAALAEYAGRLAAAPARAGGFRVGRRSLAAWLRDVEASRVPLTTVYRAARTHLRFEHQRLLGAARRLARGLAPEHALRLLEEERAGPDGLLRSAAEQVAELRAFTVGRDLVSVPEDQPCRVAAAPEFLAALTSACLDMPGPLHPSPGGTCYYLAVPRPGMPHAEQDALLRDLHLTRLTWVSAHETYPGHHVQYLHLRRAPHPILAVADSEVFIEGWAHYAEGLLVERHFRDGDLRLRVGVLWARVLRLCRMLAALGLHAGRGSPEAALRLFQRHAFLHESEARRETLRAVSDPLVLSYALGRMRIAARRRAAMRRAGPRFSLREFHDRLLAQGNVPLDLRTP
ncbi:MAG: DUF885 family protein [Planctomycetes bacterium]|nr:DUF885 family protein [Planctomycetota bacterium]